MSTLWYPCDAFWLDYSSIQEDASFMYWHGREEASRWTCSDWDWFDCACHWSASYSPGPPWLPNYPKNSSKLTLMCVIKAWLSVFVWDCPTSASFMLLCGGILNETAAAVGYFCYFIPFSWISISFFTQQLLFLGSTLRITRIVMLFYHSKSVTERKLQRLSTNFMQWSYPLT